MEGQKPPWTMVAPFGVELKSYWALWESITFIDNIVYRKWEYCERNGEARNQVILPLSLCKKAFSLLHETVTADHLGQQKTLGKIKQRFYWHRCREDIEYWCRVCDVCSFRKQPYRKAKAPMKQYNVGYSLERVAMDLMGPLPCTNVNKVRYLLLVSCYFTKWLDAIPLAITDAKTIAAKLIESFISVFGVPDQLHSDQGSSVSHKFLKRYVIC